jgi:chaperonin GroEL
VRRALAIPLRRIAASAGEIGAMAVARVYEHDDPEWGFDARSATYANMVERGVIDPLRVVRVALANAASAAGLVITTETVVAERPKPKRVVSAFPDG